MSKDYPLHPGQTEMSPQFVQLPLENYEAISGELAELRTHEVEWDLAKARIKELEAERRWRKFSEEKPSEEMEGEDFIVSNGFYSVVCEWRGYWNNEPFCGDRNYDVVKYWMPLPKTPENKQ